MDYSNVTIETERLLLVPVSEEHIPHIFEEFRLPMTKFMNYTSTGSLEELTKRHKKWRAQLQEGTKLFMAAVLKETQEFLGCFAIENPETQHPEMGGWLKLNAHGNGYGREAAQGLKSWADKNLDYTNLIWPCAKENVASRKLAESLGGTVHKEFVRNTVSGNTWEAVEYWIPSAGNETKK